MKKLILFLVIIMESIFSYALTFEDVVAPPNLLVSGKPIVEYANIWWQWTYTMPAEVSPVRDITGENCHQGQSGNVWFLAGGYGSSKIKRKCEIPAKTYIFFPVINMVYYPPKDGQLSCEHAKEYAALNNNDLLSIEIVLDSMHASNPAHTRLAPEKCFDLLGLIPRTQNPPRVYPAASDGYWVMLKPLSQGKHTLRFKAKYEGENDSYSKMVQDIEYEITIK